MARDTNADLADFYSDHRWAGWVLPVKRYIDHVMQTAILLEPVPPDTPLTLYQGNMFAGIDIKTAPQFTYASAAAAVTDGWEVD